MDILEGGTATAGRRRGQARRVGQVIAAIAGVAVLVIAIIVGAARWWESESQRPQRLEILALETVGPFAISGDDLPVGWPSDLVVGAMRVRMDVAGDPQRTRSVRPAGEVPGYAVSGSAQQARVDIPAGDRAEVDLVVTPSDCGRADDAIVSPLVGDDGAEVPMRSDAARALRQALASLCAPSAPAPLITPDATRVDVFFRDRTLVMRVRLAATPPGASAVDRVVLQPRDSTGFRAGSAQEATIVDGVATSRLRWLISPAEIAGLAVPVVRVRAFAVTSGRAYPWVLDLRVPLPGGIDPA